MFVSVKMCMSMSPKRSKASFYVKLVETNKREYTCLMHIPGSEPKAIARKAVMLPLGVVKLDDILSYIEAFSFVTIVRWQKTSVLANRSSPTLTTPK